MFRLATPTTRADSPTDTSAPQWHALDVDTVERLLATSRSGLASGEAAERLETHGRNQLEDEAPVHPLRVFVGQFADPLIVILLVAGAVTIALGELLDTSLIAAALLLNATIGFVQERRAASAVRALMQLVVPRSRVLRDGIERDLDSAELVPGDVVLLEPGTRVPADLRVLDVNGLTVDESLLTGESLPVAKRTASVAADATTSDRASMLFAGTTVSSGRGRGCVVATGTRTELGAIAGLIRLEEATEAPLRTKMDRFAKVIGISVLIASTVTFASGVILGHSADRMFHTAVAMAVSAVPEALPVAVTVTLAIGVSRMARRNAVVRHLSAVETLGSMTVVGSDKTGTLTENRMSVQVVWAGGATARAPLGGSELGDVARLALLSGVLTNEATMADGPDGPSFIGDPTEVALLQAAIEAGIDPDDARRRSKLVADIPFEPERRWSATIRIHDGRQTLFVKGAPEEVTAMCSRMLTPAGVVPIDTMVVVAAARRLAADGLRVLAMGYRQLPPDDLDDGDVVPSDLVLVGLQGMMDPPREGVSEAIEACHDAGVRVIMITGDHADTARAIALRHGLVQSAAAPVMAGADLMSIDDATLREVVGRTAVFARMSPTDKLRVVRCLHDIGHIVAVTGDGVNDAPALQAAAIGVAMGRSGTDVAREASDMVLSDDNFVSIVGAMREGRVAFANIRKVSFFLVSTAVAETAAIMLTVWLGWPLLFVPAQILWLNIVTNGVQDLALAFEPGSPDANRRPPRPRYEGILSATMWERTAVTGVVMAIGALVMFRWQLDRSDSLVTAQSVALTTMVIFNIFQVGNARSENRSLFALSPLGNPFLFWATIAALALHVTALYLPPTQFVLSVEPISLTAWRHAVVVASSILVASEAHKAVRRRWPIEPRR